MPLITSIVFIFLILRLIVAAYNYFSKPSLPFGNTQSNKKVSILIPARNEELSILTLLKSISEQNYQNYEVIILDDASSDNTYKHAKKYADAHPKFRIIKGDKLPTGWTGKNYACKQLAKAASGDYLLFVDADVKLYPQSISSALAHAEKHALALLSLFCDQKMETLGEKGVIPLMNYMLLTLLPLKLILKNSDPIFSAACGQFMLFDANNYHANQWHKRVSGEITEDLKIIKMIKQKGYKSDALLSNGLVSCRMYNSHSQAVAGFSKNLITPFNDSTLLFSVYLFLTTLAPTYLIFTEQWYLLLGMLILISLTKTFISLSSNQSVFWNILLHPIHIANLFLIGSLAIVRKHSQTGEWKGRNLYAKN